ncbi:MAG: aminoacyl-tRNA hydrolase [Clostridiales bacterium]
MNDYFIIGLGNPGKKYENTRHNVGFEVINYLAQKVGIKRTQIKHKAVIGESNIGNSRVYLIKPQTYMNLSGESVRSIVEWYKINIENLIVIYDDIDLDVGKIRIRKKGSAGSHNGMKSVIYNLGLDNFPRVRIGIGKNPDNWNLADYVLSKFSKKEIEEINNSIEASAEAVLRIIDLGIDEAMNKFNKK